jgi:hypothetical protein
MKAILRYDMVSTKPNIVKLGFDKCMKVTFKILFKFSRYHSHIRILSYYLNKELYPDAMREIDDKIKNALYSPDEAFPGQNVIFKTKHRSYHEDIKRIFNKKNQHMWHMASVAGSETEMWIHSLAFHTKKMISIMRDRTKSSTNFWKIAWLLPTFRGLVVIDHIWKRPITPLPSVETCRLYK